MIYTSYFGNLRNIRPDIVCYSIAGKTPEWYEQINDGRHWCYPALAPKLIWWKEWHVKFSNDLDSPASREWYADRYRATVLDGINASALVRVLQDHDPSKDICLLCYETPAKFCHRQIVREWLNSNGIECAEY